MKFLLDENFPLQLYRRLLAEGFAAEHVIALGKRGMPDAEIRARLGREQLVFLTQDSEFEDIRPDSPSQVIISRLAQRLPIQRRVEIWAEHLRTFARVQPSQRLFDLFEDGIRAWDVDEHSRRSSGRPI